MGALVSRYLDLLEQLWWPHWQRCQLAESLATAHAGLQARLTVFVQAIRQATAGRWVAHEPVTAPDTLTETGILDPERLALLYVQTLGGQSWPALAQEALAYAPPLPARDAAQPSPAYLRCARLSAHVADAPAVLLERLAAFAADRCAPTGRLTVLDLMELPAPVTASAYFDKAAAKLTAYPEFSSGRLPAVAQAGGLQRLRRVRCAPALSARLPQAYAHWFAAETGYFESPDASRIEMILVTAGFPGDLLHSLREPDAGSAAPASR
jgi:hypothetical protein